MGSANPLDQKVKDDETHLNLLNKGNLWVGDRLRDLGELGADGIRKLGGERTAEEIRKHNKIGHDTHEKTLKSIQSTLGTAFGDADQKDLDRAAKDREEAGKSFGETGKSASEAYKTAGAESVAKAAGIGVGITGAASGMVGKAIDGVGGAAKKISELADNFGDAHERVAEDGKKQSERLRTGYFDTTAADKALNEKKKNAPDIQAPAAHGPEQSEEKAKVIAEREQELGL